VAVARAAAREAAAMVEATVAVGRVAVRAGEARAAVRAGEARVGARVAATVAVGRVAVRAGEARAAARADRCRAPSLEVASRPDVSELVRVHSSCECTAGTCRAFLRAIKHTNRCVFLETSNLRRNTVTKPGL
jgi:hypothetical protein